jgi:hypothetical protein
MTMMPRVADDMAASIGYMACRQANNIGFAQQHSGVVIHEHCDGFILLTRSSRLMATVGVSFSDGSSDEGLVPGPQTPEPCGHGGESSVQRVEGPMYKVEKSQNIVYAGMRLTART